MPRSIGNLHGHYFNANTAVLPNLQGTGTTIVDVSPSGAMSLFAQIDLDPSKLPGACAGGVGLTTALAVLRTRNDSEWKTNCQQID